jgi:hypothetical protein
MVNFLQIAGRVEERIYGYSSFPAGRAHCAGDGQRQDNVGAYPLARRSVAGRHFIPDMKQGQFMMRWLTENRPIIPARMPDEMKNKEGGDSI